MRCVSAASAHLLVREGAGTRGGGGPLLVTPALARCSQRTVDAARGQVAAAAATTANRYTHTEGLSMKTGAHAQLPLH